MEHANRVVSEERLAYGSHGDIDRFLEAATGPIGDFLVAVAKLIGHCDASNSSIFDDGKSLESMLEQHGLVEWIRLYAQDLRRIFANRGAWSSLSELTDLSAHMERQLWRYLVFPWVLEDGRVRVEVPPLGLRVAGTLDMSF